MCKDTQAFKPEKDKEYRAVLDMVPGDPGIGPVTGADRPGTRPGAEGKEREDAFSGTKIFGQVKTHPEKYTTHEYGSRSGE